MPGRPRTHHPSEPVLRQLAARQHRVVTRPQLNALGVSDSAIQARVANGRLTREHPGVFALGPPLDTWHGRVLAAVLAVGAGARASHITGAGLLALRPEGPGVVHVTAPRPARAPPGAVVHRTRRPDTAPCHRRGVPCTGVARTISDLAAVHGRGEAVRAWRAADASRLLRANEVLAELVPGRAGTAVLRELLEAHLETGTPRTVQDMEDRAVDLLRPPAVPRPEVNAPLTAEGHRYRADLLWRDAGLVVELDSWIWHGTPARHAEDARRSVDLQLSGWTVVHLTWRDITRDAAATLARVSRLLELVGGRRSRR